MNLENFDYWKLSNKAKITIAGSCSLIILSLIFANTFKKK